MTGSVGQNVTISASSGVLTLSGNTINGTANLGILIDNTNAFTLTITAAIKVGAAQTWRNNSGNLLTIGAVDMNNKALTVDGTGNTLINGIVSAAGAFTKAGSGKLTLTGTNTNTGTMTVSAGVLNIQNSSALGTTASGTSVTSGAALQVQGNITVGAEALTLNGTGVSNDGALRNISGTNTYGGAITLGSATRINSDAGTLTLDVASGSAITGTQNLTFGGAGNVTVNDAIATGTGTLTKDGAGTLTLSAANTYTGLTTITAGTLREGVSNAISTGALTVNGATAVFDLGAKPFRHCWHGNCRWRGQYYRNRDVDPDQHGELRNEEWLSECNSRRDRDRAQQDHKRHRSSDRSQYLHWRNQCQWRLVAGK